MGALHEGHVSLMRTAQSMSPHVAVSIFVNPTQFGPHEDFSRYPRTLEADLTKCAEAGVEIVFAPSAEELIVEPRAVISIPHLSQCFEGAIRPGHFDGVASIVATLFNIVQPDSAVFGQKDLQQCAVIATLVQSLHFPIQLQFAPTLREQDGLAMSSRNRYLNQEERQTAALISQTLRETSDKINAVRQLTAITIHQFCVEAALKLATLGFQVDYFDAVDPHTFSPANPDRDFHLIVAARLGPVRLIDNWQVAR